MTEMDITADLSFGPYRPMIAYCQRPCQGNYPCVHLCYPAQDMYDRFEQRTFNVTKDEITQQKHLHSMILDSLGMSQITRSNAEIYMPKCKDNKQPIDPCANSVDYFTMKANGSLLYVERTGETYEDYCILMFRDLSYGALVCSSQPHASIGDSFKEW